jgi:hypothetical protein
MRLTGPAVDRSVKYTNQSAQANGIFSLSGIEKPQISPICSRKHFDVGPRGFAAVHHQQDYRKNNSMISNSYPMLAN